MEVSLTERGHAFSQLQMAARFAIIIFKKTESVIDFSKC